MTDYGAIDVWCNPFVEEGMRQFAESEVQDAAELFGQPDLFTGAVRTPDEFVEKMDRLGI